MEIIGDRPRFNLVGISQHVIRRGNNQEPYVYSNDDYVRYLQDLHDATVKNHAVIHAYVLMPPLLFIFMISYFYFVTYSYLTTC